jgi:hypothetical protein
MSFRAYLRESNKKYFGYFDLLKVLLKTGEYRILSKDPEERPVILSTLYIDGDILCTVFTEDDVPLLEQHLELYQNHIAQLQQKIQSLQAFINQSRGAAVGGAFVLPQIIDFIANPDIAFFYPLASSFLFAGLAFFFQRFTGRIVVKIISSLFFKVFRS